MSYALSGDTPVSIPPTNTTAVQGLSVGVVRLGVGYGFVPALDANLVVRNVTPEQAEVAKAIVRSTLVSTGATVEEVKWVTGGFLYARWKPTSERPAVSYATSIRDALLRASLELSPRSQIIMTRYRVNMPALRENLYVYPVGPVPEPPPRTSAQEPPDTVGLTPPTSPLIIGGAAVAAIGLLGAAVYVAQRNARTLAYRPRGRVRRNRRR